MHAEYLLSDTGPHGRWWFAFSSPRLSLPTCSTHGRAWIPSVTMATEYCHTVPPLSSAAKAEKEKNVIKVPDSEIIVYWLREMSSFQGFPYRGSTVRWFHCIVFPLVYIPQTGWATQFEFGLIEWTTMKGEEFKALIGLNRCAFCTQVYNRRAEWAMRRVPIGLGLESWLSSSTCSEEIPDTAYLHQPLTMPSL